MALSLFTKSLLPWKVVRTEFEFSALDGSRRIGWVTTWQKSRDRDLSQERKQKNNRKIVDNNRAVDRVDDGAAMV